MEEFLGQTGFQLSAAAILAVVILLVLTGRLVPRRTLEDAREDRELRARELAAERDTWRVAAERECAARIELQGQMAELLELSRTAAHVLSALPQPVSQGVTASAALARLPDAPSS